MKLYKSLFLKIGAFLIQSKESKVLYYHDTHISDKQYTSMSTPFMMFLSHINIIRKYGYKIVDCITDKNGQVQICFDDGFRGIYDNKNYFIKEKLYPTIFLAISLIGKKNYLTQDEIIELKSYGFRFQSHAWSHTNLAHLSNNDLEYELQESKKYLEDVLKCNVDELCFPLGYFSDNVCNAAKNAGYRLMYSSIPGSYYHRDHINIVPRNLVQSYDANQVKAVLGGGLFLYKKRYKDLQYC